MNQEKRQKDPDDYGTWRDFSISQNQNGSASPERQSAQPALNTFDSDSDQFEGLSRLIQNLKRKAVTSSFDGDMSGSPKVSDEHTSHPDRNTTSQRQSSPQSMSRSELIILKEIAEETYLDQLESILDENSSFTAHSDAGALRGLGDMNPRSSCDTYSIINATEFIRECTIQDLITIQKAMIDRKESDSRSLKAERSKKRSRN